MESLQVLVKAGIYILMAAGSLAAIGAVFFPNLFYAGLSLAGVLICVAGIYLSAGADFLAMVQILIYVGAVMTLIIYAIMLTNIEEIKVSHLGIKQILLSILAVSGFAVLTASAILSIDWRPLSGQNRLEVHELGAALMSRYIFPFEVLGILLFAVLIGAIVIARKDKV